MPRQIERGSPHVLRAAVANAKNALLTAFTMKPAAEGGPGNPQRDLMMRPAMNPGLVVPVPQRLAVGACMEYAGWTRTPQRITTVPDAIAQADRPAANIVAGQYPVGIAPPILPTSAGLRGKLPVT